jgi:hypothetical protein
MDKTNTQGGGDKVFCAAFVALHHVFTLYDCVDVLSDSCIRSCNECQSIAQKWSKKCLTYAVLIHQADKVSLR